MVIVALMSLRDHIVITVRNEVHDMSMLFRRLSYVRVYPRRVSLKETAAKREDGECVICQEDFRAGERCIVLPCNKEYPHIFHKDCIMPWISNHDTCPTCRGSIR